LPCMWYLLGCAIGTIYLRPEHLLYTRICITQSIYKHARAHTHTLTHSFTHSLTHTRTRSHTHTHSLSLSLSLSLSRTRTHTYTHTLSLSHATGAIAAQGRCQVHTADTVLFPYTGVLACDCGCVYTHTYTHTHTHTHTYICVCVCVCVCLCLCLCMCVCVCVCLCVYDICNMYGWINAYIIWQIPFCTPTQVCLHASADAYIHIYTIQYVCIHKFIYHTNVCM